MEELYRNCSGTVYGFLYSLCKNRELAEDLCQETFLKAIESIDRYNGQCKFSVWLCQIGRHLWYQYLRKNSRELPFGDDLSDVMDSRKRVKSVEEIVTLESEIENLMDVISGLSEEKREVVVLRLFQEMSFKEIGFVLGRTENWARVTYYRAKEHIVSRMEELNGKKG